MPSDDVKQKRTIADGIWLFLGDVMGLWFGLAMLYISGGLVVVGIVKLSEWLLGPEMGWRVGFWFVILGGVMLGVAWHKAWWKNEIRRRKAEDRHNRMDKRDES